METNSPIKTEEQIKQPENPSSQIEEENQTLQIQSEIEKEANTNNINTINSSLTSLPSDQSDKTFNKLRDLQNLLKKESALKELCKY